jgi:signal transduction histidine kinase
MISRLPIRVRLTLPFALGMALVLALTGFVIYQRVGSTLLDSVDQSLRGQAAEATQHVAHGRGILDRDTAGGPAVGQLVGSDGRVRQSTLAGLPALVSGAALRDVLGGRTVVHTGTIPGVDGDWRILAAPVQGGRAAVVVAGSLESREQALERLLRDFMIGGPLALLIVTLGGYLLAASALRPVEAMRRRAASIGASTQGARLPIPQSRDELSRLAETLNEMLARLESAVEHERRFVDDASHELRTPLAALRAELELALRHPRSKEELERALSSASDDAVRLSRLAEDLLLFARYDQGQLGLRREAVAAEVLLDEVAARYARRAQESGRPVRVERADDVLVDGDPARLEQALDNLVENAFAHGAGAVELAAIRRNGRVELHVTDEGGGVPPDFLPRAFDRFSRGDEGRAGAGTGLGLAIVDLVARAHGGEARLANRPGGGADAWISIGVLHAQR